MPALFLTCLVVGLLLAVYAMLYGVERRRVPASTLAPHEASGAHDPAAEPSPVFNLQVVSAFVAAFGVAGYLLTRFTELGALSRAGIAAAAGAASAAGAMVVLARWVIPGARREVVDERYLLQGHPATVTRSVGAENAGEIAYEADGRRYVIAALSWDGGALEVGVEVAIERVEHGVAYVERWARVEERL